jgi:hypothetical protein
VATFTLAPEQITGYTDEASREALRRAIKPPPSWFRNQPKRKSWQDIALWRIEDATEFSADDVLCDPVEVVREACRHGYGDVLAELVEGGMTADRILFLETPRQGRQRMRGNVPLAYIAFVLSGYPTVQKFMQKYRSSPLWKECGFDGVPSRSQMHEQFVRLEQHVDAFRVVSDSIALAIKRADSRFGEILFVDGSLWRSSARLHHACRDRSACVAAAGNKKVPDELPQSSDEAIAAARKEEHEAEDFDLTPAEPERTRGHVEIYVDDFGNEQRIAWYFLGGHWWWSHEGTSGLRKYGNGPLGFGGYFLPAADTMTGLCVSAETFPADIQEHDHLPALMDKVVDALGERPYIMSVDRGFTFKMTFEFAVNRGMVLVGKLRKVTGKATRESWRTQGFDEDGVPRCRGCGGPGNQHLPGLGFTITPAGEPVIRFRCELPFPGNEICRQIQTISCLAEPRLISPLSRLSELHNSVRELHSSNEQIFRHIRQRYAVIGKDISGRLARPGVPAQALRAQASMFLDLFRGALRLGYLDSRGIGVRVISSTPIRLTGEQDLATLKRLSRGQGSAKLDWILDQRRASGIDQPLDPSSTPPNAEAEGSVPA